MIYDSFVANPEKKRWDRKHQVAGLGFDHQYILFGESHAFKCTAYRHQTVHAVISRMGIRSVRRHTTYSIREKLMEPMRCSCSDCVAVMTDVTGSKDENTTKPQYTGHLSHGYLRLEQMFDNPFAQNQIEALSSKWHVFATTDDCMVYL